MRSWLVVLLAALVGFGCSSGSGAVSEGPGSETSGLAARVLDSAGDPVPGIAVRVVSLDGSWQSAVVAGSDPVLARDTTDAEGRVGFVLPGRGRVALELEDSAKAGRLEVEPGGADEREIRVSVGTRLSLDASVPGEVVSEVWLAGTAYRAKRGNDGKWSLRGVGEGTYTVAALTDSGMALLGRVRLSAGSGLDTSLASDVDSVLLEDFAVIPVRNRYGGLLGAGWWYTTTDAIYGGGSTTVPGSVYDALVPCDAGNCLEMSFRIDAAEPQRFALVGMDLDRSRGPSDTVGRLADLSRVAAVRFIAKGQGEFQFQMHLRSTEGASIACRSKVVLDEDWSRREVPIPSLVCDEGVVPDFRSAVGMTWTALVDAKIVLGRVVLVGAGPRSVFPRLRKGGVP